MAADRAEALQGSISIKSQEAAPEVPIVEVNSPVAWASGPVRVDGSLEDWAAFAPMVFADAGHASWSKGEYGGRNDLSVSLRLCRVGAMVEDHRGVRQFLLSFPSVDDSCGFIADFFIDPF